MPTPIQRPESALALARAHAIKGRLPLVLDEVVVPVHIIGDIRDPLAVGSLIFEQWVEGGPVVGEVTMVRFAVPAAQRVLAEVSHIVMGAGSAMVSNFGPRWAPGGTLAGAVIDGPRRGHLRDGRMPLTPAGVSSGGTADLTALSRTFAAIDAVFVPPQPSRQWPVNNGATAGEEVRETWIIAPGQELWVWAGIANQFFGASFFWRERFIGPEDLTV